MSLSERIKSQSIQNKAPSQNDESNDGDSNISNEANNSGDNSAEASSNENLSPAEMENRTRESLEDEVKALREENAKRRKKEQAAKEKALATAEEIFKAEREEYEANLAKMKNELKALKDLKTQEQDVDNKIKDAESNAELEILRKQMEDLKAESEASKKLIEEQKQKEEEERALRKQAAENRLKSLLTEIPEEFQEDAKAMFRGYADPSEGLLALSRAKTKGLFSKKTIEVMGRLPDDKNNNNNDSRPVNHKVRMRESLSKRLVGRTPGQKI